MNINTNLLALNSYNQLNKNEKKTTNSLEKLSSGLRIGKAADDAAGLAISEKMRAQIRGLSQAGRNIQDGMALMLTADGGLGNVQDPALERLRELAVQAANDTLTAGDRRVIQQEVNNICAGITEIVRGSVFNSQPAIKDNYARKGIVTGDMDISAGSTIIAGLNDILQFKVDNKAVQIKLDEGDYSSDDFLYMLNDKLWEQDPLLEASLSAGGTLSIAAYGHDKIDSFSGSGVSLMYDYHIGNSEGLLYGSSVMDGDLTINGSNQNLTFSLDGSLKSIVLDAGTFNQAGLINNINNKLTLAGLPVTAAMHGNNIWFEAPDHFIDGLGGSMVEINNVTSPLMDNIKKGSETAATVTGQVNLASGVTINASNNQLLFDIDNVNKSIDITVGVYGDINSLVSEINTQLSNGGIDITAQTSGGKLKFVHNLAGSDHTMSGFHGTALDALLKSYLSITPTANVSNTFVANPAIIGQKDLSAGVVIDGAHRGLSFNYNGDAVSFSLPTGSYTEGTLVTALQDKIDLAIGNPKITGSNDLKAGFITISAADNALSFEYNGDTYNCNLTTDSYTQGDLLTELQTEIDAALVSNSKMAGEVTVAYSGGKLTLNSTNPAALNTVGGTAANLLFLGAAEATDGFGYSKIASNRDLSQGIISIDASTQALSLNVNNVAYPVLLQTGYYDPDQLLAEVQSKLDTVVGNGKIAAAYDNGKLTLLNTDIGNLDIMGGGASGLLLGGYTEAATNPGKVVVGINNHKLTLTDPQITGTLNNLGGTAADLLFVQHSASTTSPVSTTVPAAIYSSANPFSGVSRTSLPYTVEGFAAPRYDEYAGAVIGAVDLSSGITIDGSNNTMQLSVTTGGVAAAHTITLSNGYYTANALLSTLQTNLSGKGVTVSYNSGKLMLTHNTMGDTNSFTVTNSSLGKALLEKTVAYTNSYSYVNGGTNNVHAVSTGTRDLSLGTNLTSSLTLNLARDGEPWKSIQLAAGNYANATAVQTALNVSLSAAGIADVTANVVSGRYLSFTYQKDGIGHAIAVDSTTDGYKPLFEAQFPNDPQYMMGATVPTQAVGQKDISGGVAITNTNNVLTFKVDGVNKQVVLDAGMYDFKNNPADLATLNTKLAIENIKASIAGNNLVFTYDNDVAGAHVLDSIGGSASYDLFYNGSGNNSATYIKGQRDLSAGVTIVDGKNDNFQFNLDGSLQQLTLTAGTYTKEQLVAEVQNQLVAIGVDMAVQLTDKNRLEFIHNRNGIHTIDGVGGSAANTIFYNDDGSQHLDDNLRLQVGANSGQVFRVEPPRINLKVLGIDHINITSHKSASQAIRKIDHAILVTSNEQSRIGAYENALGHVLANVGNAEANTTAAESRIRDADMAKEVMDFQKNNILQQAAQSMLAQANQQPQGVLQLLR